MEGKGGDHFSVPTRTFLGRVAGRRHNLDDSGAIRRPADQQRRQRPAGGDFPEEFSTRGRRTPKQPPARPRGGGSSTKSAPFRRLATRPPASEEGGREQGGAAAIMAEMREPGGRRRANGMSRTAPLRSSKREGVKAGSSPGLSRRGRRHATAWARQPIVGERCRTGRAHEVAGGTVSVRRAPKLVRRTGRRR